jgi:hypothetical protein
MTLQGAGKHHSRHGIKRSEDHNSIILAGSSCRLLEGRRRVFRLFHSDLGASADSSRHKCLDQGRRRWPERGLARGVTIQ